jgi:ferredoxin
MPATREEIHDALEERVQIHTRRGPNKILARDGRVVGLETVACTSVFDSTGRFNPQFAEGTEEALDADTIIMAIGQTSDLAWVRPEDGIELTPRNTIKVDPSTLATSAPGIFAGGDVSFGPRNAIDAIANGKKAAQSIHRYLTGQVNVEVEVELNTRGAEIIVANTGAYKRKWGYEQCQRVPVPALAIDRRIGLSQIELGYTEDQAQQEAARCLHCWENTIFTEEGEESGSECILCGGCVDICPESCIELVAVNQFEAEPPLAAEVGEHFDVLIRGQNETDVGSVMIKDEDICIRCGLCAMRCPVGCITMESYTVSASMNIE